MARPSNKRRWIIIGLVVLAVAGGWWLKGKMFGGPPGGGPGGMGPGGMALPVEGTPAVKGRIGQKLTVVGQVDAINGASLKAEIAGRVIKVGNEDGQPVKKGTILFKLDDSVLKAQYGQAVANLSLAENTAARQQRLLAVGAAS